MTGGLPSREIGPVIAERIRAAHRDLAQVWLQELADLLPVQPNNIFPSEEILDHIPALIREIADYVGQETTEAAAANTIILSKASELGDLRFEQQASVHQLLREYRILGGVLSDFVRDQFRSLPYAEATEGIDALSRLNEAVFVLLQTTVDTFVDRYTQKIEQQTTRLEGFNRMVSHELRQPLSSVQYAVGLLAAEPGPGDDPKRRRILDIADRNVKRLGDLIRMLGTLARPERDNLQLQTVEVSKIVSDAVRQLEDDAAAKGVEVRNAVGPGALTVDVARLELVFVNLLSNGIKYRDPAKASCFVEFSMERGDGVCHLCVRDNGLGIGAQDRLEVFRRFYRAHAARDEELGNDGVGLGLAIAAECVKGMGGTITLESTEGVGTQFRITLPDNPPPAES